MSQKGDKKTPTIILHVKSSEHVLVAPALQLLACWYWNFLMVPRAYYLVGCFCDVFILLCSVAGLFTTYCIFIIRYFVTLHWIWCLYHSYVGEVVRFKIFWHHNGPFGSSSSHYSYFFKGARRSFSGLTCCLRLFRMLGFDRFCISFSFLAKWSPYFSWCGGTCKDQYLSLLGSITGYLCDVTLSCLITCFAFWKSSGAIISLNIVFFDGPTS